MSTTTRIAAVALILAFATSSAPAQDGPAQQRIAYVEQGRSLHHQAILDGSHRHLQSPTVPVSTTEPAVQPQYSFASDPYGFAGIINSYRASAGLPQVAYDPNLSAWAAQNNAAQCRHGLGHHILPGCLQNCGWNYSDAWSCAQGWINSPGHRQNMLSPSITRFGIAYGPGPYWTLNAR